MTISEIIAALTPYTGRFPKAAVQEAVAQREAITPHLLEAMVQVANAPEEFAKREHDMLHVFAVYLLAQFREKRAYLHLVKSLAAPAEAVDRLFGDTVTERLKNILASVYDGNPEPLKRLIEDEAVFKYVRGAAVDAFLILAYTGQISPQQVSDYYRSLFREKLPRQYGLVWNHLACAVADLPAPELIEDLRKVFEEGLVDHNDWDLKRLERDACTPVEQKPDSMRSRFGLVGDAISEMEWWASFHRHEKPSRLRSPRPVMPPFTSPARRTETRADSPPLAKATPPPKHKPKVGRNEPCPCGSGKKFKKCCWGKYPFQ
jgi:Protein of unknown function (DUF1186)/SEC-C motif